MKSQKKNKFSIFRYLRIIFFSSREEGFYENIGHLTYRAPNDEVVASYVTPKLELIKKSIAFCPGEKAIDIGCGNGTFTYYLSNFLKVTGIDKSKKMLDGFPCTLPRVLAKAEDLPFKNKTFDLVFEANVLHHLKNENKVIDEMSRLSRKYIVIIEPNGFNPLMFLFSLLHKPDRKVLKLKTKKLIELLETFNFKKMKIFRTGMIFQNATPRIFIPFLRIFDRNFLFGAYNILIFEKV